MLQRYDAPTSGSDSEESHPRKKRRSQLPTSSASSSSSGSSSSSSTSAAEEVQTAGLLLSQLVSLNEGPDGDASSYALQAKNPERVKTALKEPCCKAGCKKKLQFSFVMKMIMFFWALPKVSQDCVLWSLQQPCASTKLEDFDDFEEGESSDSEMSQQKQRMSWRIEGILVMFIFIVHKK